MKQNEKNKKDVELTKKSEKIKKYKRILMLPHERMKPYFKRLEERRDMFLSAISNINLEMLSREEEEMLAKVFGGTYTLAIFCDIQIDEDIEMFKKYPNLEELVSKFEKDVEMKLGKEPKLVAFSKHLQSSFDKEIERIGG